MNFLNMMNDMSIKHYGTFLCFCVVSVCESVLVATGDDISGLAAARRRQTARKSRVSTVARRAALGVLSPLSVLRVCSPLLLLFGPLVRVLIHHHGMRKANNRVPGSNRRSRDVPTTVPCFSSCCATSLDCTNTLPCCLPLSLCRYYDF